MANQTRPHLHKLFIAHRKLLVYARIAVKTFVPQETNLPSFLNPAITFYGTSIFFVFTVWLLWKIAKSASDASDSLKELAKSPQKPQS
jgi:hypothetical protein